MSWQGEMVTIVRYLVSDTDPLNYTYSNERIETTLLVSAQIVQTEIDFEQTYTIDVEQCYLSPDPTDPSTGLATANKDDAFINLVSLKAAVLITSSELKTYSLSAISVTDGPSSINYTEIATNVRNLHDYALKAYQEYKFNYISGTNSVGKAILSPYGPGGDIAYVYQRQNYR